MPEYESVRRHCRTELPGTPTLYAVFGVCLDHQRRKVDRVSLEHTNDCLERCERRRNNGLVLPTISSARLFVCPPGQRSAMFLSDAMKL